MHIDHIALWTTQLERCKQFYVSYFGATSGPGYTKPSKGFASCFLNFASDARIAITARVILNTVK